MDIAEKCRRWTSGARLRTLTFHDFSHVLRKRRTKLFGPRAILTNFTNSRYIFVIVFFWEFLLRGIFEQGKAADSQKFAKLFAFLDCRLSPAPDPSSSHFCKAHQGDFHRDGDDGTCSPFSKTENRATENSLNKMTNHLHVRSAINRFHSLWP